MGHTSPHLTEHAAASDRFSQHMRTYSQLGSGNLNTAGLQAPKHCQSKVLQHINESETSVLFLLNETMMGETHCVYNA